MILPKSSANKIAEKYDFRFALKSMIFPSFVSFVIATIIFVIRPLLNMSYYVVKTNGKINAFKTIEAIKVDYSSILTFQLYSGYIIAGIFTICVGVLFAFVAFAFLMKKNRVNVFLSGTVGRAAIYKNRVVAAIILMAVSSGLPLIADVIININIFGHTGYFLWHGLLLFGEYMTYMLAGFSIMSISMLACNTVIECLFFGAGLLWLPTFAAGGVGLIANSFLRGFTLSDNGSKLIVKSSIANPLIFGKAFGNYRCYDNMLSFVFRGSDTQITNDIDVMSSYGIGYHIDTSYKWAQMNFIAPFLIWMGVCAVLIYVGKLVFLRRKAENAGIHATSYIPTAIFTVEMSALAGAGVIGLCTENKVAAGATDVIVSIVIMLVVYYILNCIAKRRVKLPKKVHLTAIGEIVGFCAVLLIISTGFFGYSSRVPDAKDVEYATMKGEYIDASGDERAIGDSCDDFSSITYIFDSFSGKNLGIFSSEEDISKFIDVNKAIARKTDDMTGTSYTVMYKLKNGNTFERTYKTTDYEASLYALSLTDTDAYRDELEFLLSSKRADETESNLLKILNNDWTDLDYTYDSGLFSYSSEIMVKQLLHNHSARLISNDLASMGDIENTPELKDAILADKLSADYMQKFRSKSKPLGEIIFYDPRASEEYTASNADIDEDYFVAITIRYYIYDDMVNTISYLKSTGEYKIIDNEKDYDFEEALLAKVSEYRDINVSEYGINPLTMTYLFSGFIATVPQYADESYESISKRISAMTAENIYKTNDKQKIAQLYDVSRSFAYAHNDDYIAVFTLPDNTSVVKLIYSSDLQQ